MEVPDDIPHIDIGLEQFYELDKLNQIKDKVFVFSSRWYWEKDGLYLYKNRVIIISE